MNWRKYIGVALLVILIDQGLKMWVYFSYQSWPLNIFGDHELNIFGDWFRLHYLLNPGMAFGYKFDNEFGKLALTLFRIVAIIGITVYLFRSIKNKAHAGMLVCMSLILGGAMGNVIDSTFYGVLLNNAPSGSPTPWFHGQVIDMLFFPLFEFSLPHWVPRIGGERFLFFSPVFNIADSAIFLGAAGIILFQWAFFPSDNKENDVVAEGNTDNVVKAQIEIQAASPNIFQAFSDRETFQSWFFENQPGHTITGFQFVEGNQWQYGANEPVAEVPPSHYGFDSIADGKEIVINELQPSPSTLQFLFLEVGEGITSVSHKISFQPSDDEAHKATILQQADARLDRLRTVVGRDSVPENHEKGETTE